MRLTFLTLFALLSLAIAAQEPHFSNDGQFVIEGDREIPVAYEADVVVIHAGLSGTMAAVAAQRHGADTILVERSGRPVIQSPLPMGIVIGIDGWRPTIQEGMFREFAEEIVTLGQYAYRYFTLQETLDREAIIIRRHDVVYTAMLNMLYDAGVRMLFHTQFVDTVVNNTLLKGIIVEAPQGRVAIRAEVFIDATDLADVAYRAGAPTLREEAFMGAQALFAGADYAFDQRV
jgi:flavin-dependent dehydrogenase